jgi:uncharacterized protein (TIGR02099 family)
LDIPIGKAHAEIPSLGGDKPAVLTVKSEEVQGDLAQGLAFIHASPLEKKFGKIFTGLALQGPMGLTLTLTVPMANPDYTQVSGDVTMKHAQLNLVPWHLLLVDLNGKLQFTEKTTQASAITGKLFNQPVQLSLETIQKSPTDAIVRATLTNHINIDDLVNWLKMPFEKYSAGSTDIKAVIDFSLQAPTEVHVTSDLSGVSLDLPEPYAKKSDQTLASSADIIIEEGQPLKLKAMYGSALSAALILDRKNDSFVLTGLNLRLGGGDPVWPEQSGLYISGNLDKLDMDKIKELANQSGQTSSLDLTLREIDVTVGQLDLLGQVLTQARIEATPANNEWQLDINSQQVAGELEVPKNLSNKATISGRFEKLELKSAANDKANALDIDFKQLPSLNLTAQNVTFNGLAIGQLTLKTNAQADGQTIQALNIASPNINLQSSGNWNRSGRSYTTHLKGKAVSNHVTDFLTNMGVDAHNFVANKGQFSFDLNWQNAFYAPTLATMKGTASLDIGPGRIVNVGETSGAKMDLGRMLNIFSLQTIPRRLSGDFSDIFQKGYSFDSLRGDFKLNNGNAVTSNMRFDGPVARVGINGRIGLSRKDVDFTLSVTPYVTSSIPVAATLITANPLVGLGALAVNTVIGSQVSKVATYHYAVSGSWDNPSWQSIGGR